MKRIGIIILGSLLWMGCGNDEEQLSEAYTDINIVTGLDLYDLNGNSIGTWEKPNHRPGPLRIYPIPAGDALTVSSQSIITDIWVIPASCEKDTTKRNISELSLDLRYSMSEVEMNKISSVQIDNFNNSLSINLTGSTPGFYRLFARTPNDDLFWQNFYYDPELVPLLDLSLLDLVCN